MRHLADAVPAPVRGRHGQRSVGAATIANIADVESHDDPTPTVTKMITATISEDSPDTDVTVARADPVMESCSLASLTTATFSLSP